MQDDGRDVAPERTAIERAIRGRTLVGAFTETVARLGDAAAIHWRSIERWHDPRPGDWRTVTWNDMARQVRSLFAALRLLGVEREHFAVLIARNHPSHVVADQALMHLGATAVSLYPTLSPDQLAYQAGHCGARVAVVHGEDALERVVAVAGIEHIVAVEATAGDPRVLNWDEVLAMGAEEDRRDPAAFETEPSRVRPDDLATLMYTSGTTGSPKAVMMTHRNVLWIEASLCLVAPMDARDRLVSYLPMAHIAERFLSAWRPAIRGATVWMCPDPLLLPVALTEARPTWFFGVPRVWEKYAAALEPAWARAQQSGASPAAAAAMLLERTGLDRCRVAMTGGAPVAPEILELFCSMGLEVSEMWGLTETGVSTWTGVPNRRIGTVGRPMPGVEVRLADDGELLVRGGNVTTGYYRDPRATAEAIDPEGWFHTGDIGTVDPDGCIRVVDRKKEIIVTAGGKNVSPATLEGLVRRHPIVGQACVVGDRRPYPSALVVLDPAGAAEWASARGIEHAALGDLASHPDVRAEVESAVDAANQMVSQPEQIKRFTILPMEWTVGSGEVSPTLKLKRRLILWRYAAEIENMYR